MAWVQQHYEGIIALAGALWTILSVINGMIKNPEVKGVLGKVIDALAYVSRKDAHGSVKLPFTASKPVPQPVANPEGASDR